MSSVVKLIGFVRVAHTHTFYEYVAFQNTLWGEDIYLTAKYSVMRGFLVLNLEFLPMFSYGVIFLSL